MSKTKNLPRFLIADNPMVGDECYIIVTRKIMCILRVSDWCVMVGEADEGLIARAKDVYTAYLVNLDK